jgi:hypothetical protein
MSIVRRFGQAVREDGDIRRAAALDQLHSHHVRCTFWRQPTDGERHDHNTAGENNLRTSRVFYINSCYLKGSCVTLRNEHPIGSQQAENMH